MAVCDLFDGAGMLCCYGLWVGEGPERWGAG